MGTRTTGSVWYSPLNRYRLVIIDVGTSLDFSNHLITAMGMSMEERYMLYPLKNKRVKKNSFSTHWYSVYLFVTVTRVLNGYTGTKWVSRFFNKNYMGIPMYNG